MKILLFILSACIFNFAHAESNDKPYGVIYFKGSIVESPTNEEFISLDSDALNISEGISYESDIKAFKEKYSHWIEDANITKAEDNIKTLQLIYF